MWNQTNGPDYQAGIRLLKQEYEAAIAEIKVREDLTKVERLRLRLERAKEYRRHRALERDAIHTQIRADCDVVVTL